LAKHFAQTGQRGKNTDNTNINNYIVETTTINSTQTGTNNQNNNNEANEPFRFVDSELDLEDSTTFKMCMDKSITDLYNLSVTLGLIENDDNYLEHVNDMPATSHREVLERLAGLHAKLVDHNLD
jgi:hypothetical protein